MKKEFWRWDRGHLLPRPPHDQHYNISPFLFSTPAIAERTAKLLRQKKWIPEWAVEEFLEKTKMKGGANGH